jgi:polyhydroxybutyrate depolymerase
MFRRIVNWQSIVFVVFILTFSVASVQAGPGCKSLEGEPGFYPNLTIESGGLTRTYHLYVPPKYKNSRPTPLVFNFHGLGSNGLSQYSYSEMEALAEKYKLIIVAPEGIGNSWNGGLCCDPAATENYDDVGFVSDLIDKIMEDYCINPDRIFATGISNGGFISNRLACELSDRIAAIAPVASANYTNYSLSCQTPRPVPVIAFNGTDDILVPYNAGMASIQAWAINNGCSNETTITYQKGDVTCIAYEDCQEDATVEFCTVDGGGHNWPGAIDLVELDPVTYWWAGYTTQDIDASRAIWKFFAEHSFPDRD